MTHQSKHNLVTVSLAAAVVALLLWVSSNHGHVPVHFQISSAHVAPTMPYHVQGMPALPRTFANVQRRPLMIHRASNTPTDVELPPRPQLDISASTDSPQTASLAQTEEPRLSNTLQVIGGAVFLGASIKVIAAAVCTVAVGSVLFGLVSAWADQQQALRVAEEGESSEDLRLNLLPEGQAVGGGTQYNPQPQAKESDAVPVVTMVTEKPAVLSEVVSDTKATMELSASEAGEEQMEKPLFYDTQPPTEASTTQQPSDGQVTDDEEAFQQLYNEVARLAEEELEAQRFAALQEAGREYERMLMQRQKEEMEAELKSIDFSDVKAPSIPCENDIPENEVAPAAMEMQQPQQQLEESVAQMARDEKKTSGKKKRSRSDRRSKKQKKAKSVVETVKLSQKQDVVAAMSTTETLQAQQQEVAQSPEVADPLLQKDSEDVVSPLSTLPIMQLFQTDGQGAGEQKESGMAAAAESSSRQSMSK